VTTKDDNEDEQRLLEAIKWLDGRGIQAGVFGGTNRLASKKRKTRRPKKGRPIALYALVQHEGNRSGTIQARRFISDAVDTNQAKWEREFENGFEEVLKGRKTTEGLLTEIGMIDVVGDIQEMITTLEVIDTGALRQAIRAKIRKGEPQE